MVNIKRETLTHKSHNKILLAIGEEKDYAASIGKKIGLERSDVKQQLDQLRKREFVILDDTKQHKNKKYYSINWYQLALEFANYGVKSRNGHIEDTQAWSGLPTISGRATLIDNAKDKLGI